MKKITLLFTLLLVVVVGFVVIGRKAEGLNPGQEPREIREQRRAARQEATEKQIDSIVLARSFNFFPQTMQVEPAGRSQMLQNPNFEVTVWRGAADIFLPYVKGIVQPYRNSIINYTVSGLDSYVTEQTDDGWRVSFETGLYSASTYTFIFEINSKFGTTVLTLKNQWYSTITYNGMISKRY